MARIDIAGWIAENHFSREGVVWCVKRLSANDTLATRAHQAGPYMPRDFLLEVFPEINRPHDENPDTSFALYLDSHADHRQARAVWYNRKSRNEVRITRLGGASSALLDPESTGALAVFSFSPSFSPPRDAPGCECRAWVCTSVPEEDAVLDAVGWVEPGAFRFAGCPAGPSYAEPAEASRDCWLAPDDIPKAWFAAFPDADELLGTVVERLPLHSLSADERLIRRRTCEYEMFRSVEEAVALPVIRNGFATMDDFLAFAQTTLQRRRARSGRSLELHARRIFVEEGLKEHRDFVHGAQSEAGSRPDFLFPSKACYDDPGYPAQRLRMLAVKTTCRDRWRQILAEAARIPVKHLLTLQKGVSDAQFAQMRRAGVQLVVPSALVPSYPASLRPELTTLERFIGDIRLLRSTAKP